MEVLSSVRRAESGFNHQDVHQSGENYLRSTGKEELNQGYSSEFPDSLEDPWGLAGET